MLAGMAHAWPYLSRYERCVVRQLERNNVQMIEWPREKLYAVASILLYELSTSLPPTCTRPLTHAHARAHTLTALSWARTLGPHAGAHTGTQQKSGIT